MAADRLAPWRAGADLDVLAPFSTPADLLGEGEVIVLLASDVDALAYAATTGAELLLRTSPRAQRARSLTSGPPVASAHVATSVDALGSDVLRRELLAERREAPWCIWWPESVLPSQRGHGGRGGQLRRVRAGFEGPVLRRWSDGALAPGGLPYIPGNPGALRLGSAAPVVAGGRAITRGTHPSWTESAARAGQARRDHALADPFPRSWRRAEAALREEEAGVDLLPLGGAGQPRGRTLLRSVAGPWALAVPRGAAVAWMPEGATESAPVEGGQRGEGWTVVSLQSAEQAWTLEAAPGIEGLRPTWAEVRVADQHRFRPPFVEREPEYLELHRAYSAAMQTWDLEQRARLALSDRGPRDLVGLAQALSLEPAWIADVLLSMADDGLMAATLHGRAPGGDWQATVLGAPGLAPDPDPRLQGLLSASGCRAQALAAALSVPDPGACGLCDRCDPSDGWVTSLEQGPVRASGPLAHAPSSASARSLGSLFSGLGAAPSAPAPPGPKVIAPVRVPVIGAELPEAELADLVSEHGAAALWVAAAFQYRGPVAGRPVPPAVRDALLTVLLDPEVTPDGCSVKHGPGGRVHIHRRTDPARGAHQFRPRGLDGLLLGRLAALEVEGGSLSELAHLRAAARARTSWISEVEGAVERWLASEPGLPRPDSLPAPADPAWLAGDLPMLAMLRMLEAPPSLAEAGKELLGGRGALDSLPARLALRALFLHPPATLRPEEATRWLAGPEAPAPDLLSRVRGGSRRAWTRLLASLDEDHLPAGLDAAIEAGALPADRAEAALGRVSDVQGEARVRAALPVPADVDAAWLADVGGRPVSEQIALADALESLKGESARAWAQAARRCLLRGDEDAARREAICREHGAGHLAAAFALLSERGAPKGPAFQPDAEQLATFARIRAEAAQAQRAFTPALARGLAAGALGEGTAGEAGQQALADAAAAGWGGAMVALLRGQVRRHPADAARRAWLGRALLEAGRWAEAHAEFAEADRLIGGESGLDLRWAAIERMVSQAPAADALRALEGLVRRGPAHDISRRIALLARGGALRSDVAAPLAELLRNEGSGVWAGAMRALRPG